MKIVCIVLLIMALMGGCMKSETGGTGKPASPRTTTSRIGTAAYHEPECGIGEPAYHEPAGSIGDAAANEPR